MEGTMSLSPLGNIYFTPGRERAAEKIARIKGAHPEDGDEDLLRLVEYLEDSSAVSIIIPARVGRTPVTYGLDVVGKVYKQQENYYIFFNLVGGENAQPDKLSPEDIQRQLKLPRNGSLSVTISIPEQANLIHSDLKNEAAIANAKFMLRITKNTIEYFIKR